jgi:hypothetical protein
MTLREATNALRDLEETLRSSEPLDRVAAAKQVQAVRRLLSTDDAQWIGTTEAKRLLGVASENTVKAWARLDLLRHRRLPNGRTQVFLEDVLRRQTERAALTAFGGEDLTPDELDGLRTMRSPNPWDLPLNE